MGQTPEYKKRFPGIRPGMTAIDYDQFKRQANAAWLETRGREIRDDEVEKLMRGEAIPADTEGWA